MDNKGLDVVDDRYTLGVYPASSQHNHDSEFFAPPLPLPFFLFLIYRTFLHCVLFPQVPECQDAQSVCVISARIAC